MNRDSHRIFDEYLVAAAVTGDRPALVRLIERWQPKLLRYAWRVTGDADRAKDMVQEAWVDILRGLAKLDDVAAFPAWAYRIVTRRCHRALHHAGREVALDDEGEMETPFAAAEYVSGESVADVSTVMQAIATLPGPQRAALALFYIEELSVAEIAIATDVPPGTVKTRLMHARNKIRALLEGAQS